MSKADYQIFVDGLNYDTTDESFLTHFKNFGKVTFHRIIRDQDGRSLGCGIIKYASTPMAEAALSVKCHYIGGRRIECRKQLAFKKCSIVDFYHNFDEDDLPKHLRKLFVGNLGSNSTKIQLKNYFDNFGEVENVFIGRKQIQKSKCFGFVTFRNFTSVDRVQNKRPHVIENKQVQTCRAYPQNTSNNNEKPTTVLLVQNVKKLDAIEIEDYFSQFGFIMRVSSKCIDNLEYIALEFEDYDDVDKICLIGIHCVKNDVLSVQKHHEEISNPIDTVTSGLDWKPNVDNSSFQSKSFENSTWNNTVTSSPSAPPLGFENNLYYALQPPVVTYPLPENHYLPEIPVPVDEPQRLKTCCANMVVYIILISVVICAVYFFLHFFTQKFK